MNEQTQQLIEKLAIKFGTTAEHLWSVLIHQAPISAASDIAVLCFWAIAIAIAHRNLRSKFSEGGDWYDNNDSTPKFFAWMLWYCALGFFFTCVGFAFNEIITGFFNPEFWALKQILP